MFENGRAWFSLRFFSYREWVRCLIVQLSFKKSFAVSSIDSRMKPSRHKLNSLSPVLPWMKMFAWISASGAGVIWGLKKGNVGGLALLGSLTSRTAWSHGITLYFWVGCKAHALSSGSPDFLLTQDSFVFQEYSCINLSWMLANKFQGTQFKYSLLSVPSSSWAFWALVVCLKRK